MPKFSLPSDQKERPKKYQAVLAAVLILVSIAIVFQVRLHTYNEPLERDLTFYAVVGHELLNERLLYTDLWDHKPPAIYVTYALAELLFGYGINAIFWLGVAAALATLFGLYLCVTWLTGERLLGGLTALLWGLSCSDLYL